MSLLRRLLGRGGSNETSQNAPFSTRIMPEHRVAVVGDIHGRADLLERMIETLTNQALDHIVFVGDYVDRGEDSADVLKKLKSFGEENPSAVFLRGNHEKMLLDFLDKPRDRGLRWMRNGGLQTLASFGIKGLRDTMSEDEMEAAAAKFQQAMPSGLEDWIRQTVLSWYSGNLWVVHGAADPTVPMEDQNERVLLWGHRDFFTHNRTDQQWVAHGHTIVDEAKYENGRISVDTGAYATGQLTAAIVGPDGELQFVHT